MPMKNPPHVGRVIWHGVFEPLGLSVTKAAEALGVRRATLSDLVNGKSALTAEMALRADHAERDHERNKRAGDAARDRGDDDRAVEDVHLSIILSICSQS